MSFNYMPSVAIVEAARLPEPQQTSNVVKPMQRDTVQRSAAITGGGDMPPGKAEGVKDAADVESTVSRISDFVQNFQRSLQFSVDKDSGRTVIKVVDSATEEVIRQIPAEEILRMAQRLDSPESLMLLERA